MFVLHEHETATPAGAQSAPPGRHWDLMIEVPGCDRLATWRLAQNPLTTAGPVPAERMADHRRLYLEYEGEISGGRGLVRRADHGPATVERLTDDEVVVVLAGQHLRGRFEVAHDRQKQMVFRLMPGGEMPPSR